MKIFLDNRTNVPYYRTAQSLRNATERTVSLKDDFRRLLRDVLAYSAAGCCKDFMQKIGDFLRFSSGMLANLESVIHSRKMLSRARLTILEGAIPQVLHNKNSKSLIAQRRIS